VDRRSELAEGYNTDPAASGRLGVAAGDAVVIELEADDQPRTVDPPPDLAGALAADPEARAAFDGLSFTHQREYSEWVAGAKRETTRRRRVDQAVQMLRDGRRHP
jgi:uncharacterized protein YdeI (YjbR/CyaY-like superfamily)